MHGEVCIFLPACVFIHNSLSKCYSSECLCVCYHLCKTPTSLLGVCDKLFDPHGAAEPTCADTEAADIWPGHTDKGLMQAMALLQSEETTSLQAQKPDCALLSFPFAVSFSLSRRARKF